MRSILLAGLSVVVSLAFGCEPTRQDHMSNPVIVPPLAAKATTETPTYDYQHKVVVTPVQEPKIGEGRVLRWRIAVARFGDLRIPAGSPFIKPAYEVSAAGGEVNIAPTDVEPCPAFTGLLIQVLTDSKRFIVLERKEINKLLNEQDFGASGRVRPQTAAALRQVEGVEVMVTGEVATMKVGDKPQVAAFIRIYDVESSEILGSAKVVADNVHEAVEKAAKEVTAALKDRPWVVKISSVRGRTVILNAGASDGINAGDQFTIVSLGRKVRDPDEGTVLGRVENEAGRIEITNVMEKYSEAKILKQTIEFVVGDRAEFVPGPYSQHDLGTSGGGL